MSVRKDTVQVEVEINGQKVQNTITDLNKAYKQLNKERSLLTIGTEEYVKKTESLKDVSDRLKDVKKEVNGIEEANKGALEGFMAFMPFNGRFQQMKGSLGGVKGQVLDVSKGFGTLRGAIIGTGIGAFLVVLGVLINYLTTTQEGIDKVTAVTKPLSVIFQRLMGVVQELGGKWFKALGDAVKHPKQALSDLVDFIKDNVLARFQAFGVAYQAITKMMKGEMGLTEGMKELTNAAIQGTTGIRNGVEKLGEAAQATKAFLEESIAIGTKMDQLQKSIERDEINTIKRRKELELIAKQQNFIVEDETKSYDERRKAAQTALQAQEELMSIQLGLMDQKIEMMQLEQSLNDTSRENEKELAELMANRSEMAGSVVEMQTTMRNKLNTLNKAEAAEHQKMLDEKRKAREEQLKKEEAAEKALQDLRIQAMQEGLERSIAEINLEYERKREAIDGNEVQITEQQTLLEHERQAKLQEVKVEWEEKEKERKEKEYQQKLEAEIEKDEIERLQLEEKYARHLMVEDEYEEAKYELQKEALEKRLEMIKAFHGEESIEAQRVSTELAQLEKARADQKVETEKKAEEQIQKIKDAGVQFSKDALQIGIDLLSEDEETKKKHAKTIKALTVANITVSLAEEMQHIWKNAAAMGPWGIAVGILQTAVAGARASMAINKVTSTKYAKGGIFGGSRHSSGGNAVIDRQTGQEVAEVEAGEPYMIFSRKAYANNKPVIDQLLYSSMYQDGAPIFETGGIMNPYSSGARADAAAPNASAAIAGQAGQAMNTAGSALDIQILAELRRLNMAFESFPKSLKAFVVLHELEAKEAELQSVREDAQVK